MREVLGHVLPWSLDGSARAQGLYVLALALLLLGTALSSVALAVRRLDVIAVATASGGAAAWLLCNTPGEGGSLVEVFHGNGITVADLAAMPAGALVLVLAARRLVQEQPRRSSPGVRADR